MTETLYCSACHEDLVGAKAILFPATGPVHLACWENRPRACALCGVGIGAERESGLCAGCDKAASA